MSKRPDKDRQTLDHRSPECLWHGKTIDQLMDMWSVAVVAAYMCGHPFCKVGGGEVQRLIRQWVVQLGAPPADDFTGYPAWETDQRLLSNSLTAACPWPPPYGDCLGEIRPGVGELALLLHSARASELFRSTRASFHGGGFLPSYGRMPRCH